MISVTTVCRFSFKYSIKNIFLGLIDYIILQENAVDELSKDNVIKD